MRHIKLPKNEIDVYIAGSLRHTSREWWKTYERIGEKIKEVGLRPYIPHIHTIKEVNQRQEDIHNPNLSLELREAVFKKNLEIIKKSKLIVAEVSNPSTGTGVEIGFALLYKKPIICLAKKGADISSMVLGPVNSGLIDLIRYESLDEGLEKLKLLIENKFKNLISSV